MIDALLISAAVLCQSADIATTYQALGRGYREGNPVFAGAGRGPVVAIKVTVDAGMFLWMAKAKQPAVKRAIPTTLAVAGCAGAALNLDTMKRGAR